MSYRLSKAVRTKISVPRKLQTADPAFRAALSERMKRLRSDPVFNAAHRAAMKHRRIDPKLRAAFRAAIKRRNADPAFRAKQLATVSIPPETRTVIIAALRADPHARRVARTVGGASYSTVLRIARAVRIKLRPPKLSRRQKREAIQRRARGEVLSAIARSYNVHPSTICRLAA
jgi:hypothetical protein